MASRELNTNSSTVTLHVVSSLDGFIARHDNSVSWLDTSPEVYERGVSEESAAEIISAIDCYVLGSRTYEHALQLGWPYGDTPTVVVTSRELPSARKSVEFYAGDLKTLVDEIQEMGFKEMEWKGTNSSGYFLPSGVYLYRLETSSLITPGKVFTEVKKMLLIR